MAIAYGLMGQLVHAPTRKERVSALATLVMWFAVGAFVASLINDHISQIPNGLLADAVGGFVGVALGTFFKAV
jgi:uncharacterized membrane protein required for colicin V production